jgi:hypothetical protein
MPREIFIVSELTKISSACVKGKVWIIQDSGRSVKTPGKGQTTGSHERLDMLTEDGH